MNHLSTESFEIIYEQNVVNRSTHPLSALLLLPSSHRISDQALGICSRRWMKTLNPSGNYRRSLLFFHHILSSRKRLLIRDEALRLGVSGVVKVGHPGVLVVQGPTEGLGQYIRIIKVSKFFRMYASSGRSRAGKNSNNAGSLVR
jgi:hypothetical protein